MNDAVDRSAAPAEEELPFGAAELLAAVAGARRVLDAGCGGGRLTVALAQAGTEVTAFDTNSERLEQTRRRAARAGVELRLVEADLNEPLPFGDGSFDAVTSRLALMIPEDPVAALDELRRTLVPTGRIATVLWATLAENPWFAAPREAVAAVLGVERASFARVFGRLGDPDEAAAAHRSAGLSDVEAHRVVGKAAAKDAADHWARLARENGHFRRIAAGLTDAEREAIVNEISARLARYGDGDHLAVPRTLVLVTARR
jgi:SAM-dependent methyltransferase